MDFPDFSLHGQVALVTGASQGIGHDLALALVHAGARVAVAARQLDALDRLCAEIAAAGGEGAAVELDLRDRAAIEVAVAATVERFGRLDILVNDAGLGTNHDALEATEAEWDELFAVNVRGLFFACQSAGRRMVAQRYGRIVNMSSQAGLVGIPRHAAYSASKAAVIQLTRTLAVEWAPHNVRVNAIAPGATRTPTREETLGNPVFRQNLAAQYPLGRIADPEDMVGTAVFLASDASRFITGQTIVVDGGHTLI
jgi:2-deoxy-D-gluconate 3-dehydrogenase